MIYLIITSSIANKHGIHDAVHRERTYREAITQTLSVLPEGIKPIIVENNGQRRTFLDDFGVDVFYTDNNDFRSRHKGVNELMDIKAVIRHFGIRDDDMVIKVTGRYKVMSPSFFRTIMDDQDGYDAFLKFFNVCTLKFMPREDCILGLLAMRAKLFNALEYRRGISAEREVAEYVSSTCKYKEIQELDVLCCFADDHRTLHV